MGSVSEKEIHTILLLLHFPLPGGLLCPSLGTEADKHVSGMVKSDAWPLPAAHCTSDIMVPLSVVAH